MQNTLFMNYESQSAKAFREIKKRQFCYSLPRIRFYLLIPLLSGWDHLSSDLHVISQFLGVRNSNLKTETACFSETFLPFYKTTRCLKPDSNILKKYLFTQRLYIVRQNWRFISICCGRNKRGQRLIL